MSGSAASGAAPGAGTSPSADPAVRLSGAAAAVGGRVVWSGVDVEVGEGEFVAVLGPNGAGKTTMLRVLLGDLALTAGSVSVLGREPRAARAEIGYLPQRRSFDGAARIRGVDLVRLGLDGARWGLPLRRAGEREQVQHAIAMVGAESFATRPIGQMSGGEQQRLLIAQALVRRPRLLVLDEPLDSLDLPTGTAITALLASISRRHGVTVLLVAHDVNPLLPHLDRVVYFGSGHAAWGAPRAVLNTQTLSRLYGASVEVLETAGGRLVVLGTPDAPGHHSGAHGHGHSDGGGLADSHGHAGPHGFGG